MKALLYISTLFFFAFSFAQKEAVNPTFDTIIEEATLLYQYEKVALNASDLAVESFKIRDQFDGYTIYHDADTLHAVFIHKDKKNSIAKYSYVKTALALPFRSLIGKTPLTEYELNMINVKEKALDQITKKSKKYDVSFPDGYNPNIVLIPKEKQFDLYFIMGSENPNIIPFGNDYYFKLNKHGKIKKWQKLHKTFIPSQTNLNGKKITMFMHSHLKETPHITATDICTFRLYGYDLYGLKEFKVLSTALRKVFTYNAMSNTITESELAP